MFDRRARELCRPVLDTASEHLAHLGVRANPLTGLGWTIGVVACVAVGFKWWLLALLAWLVNRLIDGLDGALARKVGATDFGGYLDLVADFSVYAGFIVALAIANPSARIASVVLLCAYYVSGTALLAAAALLDRRGIERSDERSVRFLGGLAEGLETLLAYVIMVVVPSLAVWVEWVFAGMVLITAAQRVIWARRALSSAPPAPRRTRPSDLAS